VISRCRYVPQSNGLIDAGQGPAVRAERHREHCGLTGERRSDLAVRADVPQPDRAVVAGATATAAAATGTSAPTHNNDTSTAGVKPSARTPPRRASARTRARTPARIRRASTSPGAIWFTSPTIGRRSEQIGRNRRLILITACPHTATMSGQMLRTRQPSSRCSAPG
jgi:hypothetical protein